MPGAVRRNDLVFFIHIMKTGGRSLNTMLQGKFCSDQVYPLQTEELSQRFITNISVERLKQLPYEARQRIRYLRGHFPYCVEQLFHRPIHCISFFRDPVSRTISHLKQARSFDPQHRGRELLELYEDQDFFDTQLRDLQTRYFAHELSPELVTVFDRFELTATAVARARERIATLDFIGLMEDYDTAIQMLSRYLKTPLNRAIKARFKYQECETPAELPARIANDNRHDLETFEFVKELYYRRRSNYLRSA